MSVSWGDLCRLCAAHSDLNEHTINHTSNLSQIILKYLSITIKNDEELSTRICLKCEEKITDFHTFAMQCERIQSMFVAYKNDNITNGINHQLVKTEDNVEIQIKQEFKDYNDDNNLEECTEFIEPIEIKKGKNSLIKDRRKKVRKKRKIIRPKSIIKGVEDLLKDDVKDCMKNEDKKCILDNKIIKKDEFNIIRYKCHICDVECKNWKFLSLHTSDVHGTNPQIKCICFKILSTIRSVQNHKKKHDPNKCLICDYCKKMFCAKRQLENHILTHLPKTKSYVCCKCAKSFSNPRVLKMHENIHKPREERFIWPCDICNNKFASKTTLGTHKRTIHEKIRPHICDLCGHSFSTKNDLKRHSVCHSTEKNFVCDKCNKGFKTKENLRIHIDSHGDTAYQCPHCPMLLNTRGTLKNHLYIHDESANHPCPVCEKTFKRKKDLKTHMKQHTGERPYSCPWCSRTFSNASNFRIHKRRMHPTELQLADKQNPYIRPTDEKKVMPKKIIHTIIKAHPVPLKPSDTTELSELHSIDRKESDETSNLRNAAEIV